MGGCMMVPYSYGAPIAQERATPSGTHGRTYVREGTLCYIAPNGWINSFNIVNDSRKTVYEREAKLKGEPYLIITSIVTHRTPWSKQAYTYIPQDIHTVRWFLDWPESHTHAQNHVIKWLEWMGCTRVEVMPLEPDDHGQPGTPPTPIAGMENHLG